MTKLFKDDFGAFDCFFTDSVQVSGTRANVGDFSTSAKANIFPEEYADPFSDVDVGTDIRVRKLMISKLGEDAWNFTFPIIEGDVVHTCDNKKWGVSKVIEFDNYFDIEVRSIGND